MSYESDTYTWAREQAALLRRLSAGEPITDQIDWANLIDEVETVGRSELHAATAPLTTAIQHKLYVIGWPRNESIRHWQAEVTVQLVEMLDEYRESMRQAIEASLDHLYRLAKVRAMRHMVDTPPAPPLPASCPWSFDELLKEADLRANEHNT